MCAAGPVLVVRRHVHHLRNERPHAEASGIGQVLSDVTGAVAHPLRESRGLRVQEDACRFARAGGKHDDFCADVVFASRLLVDVGDASGEPFLVRRHLARQRQLDDFQAIGQKRRRDQNGRRLEVRVRGAASVALSAVMACRTSIERTREYRETIRHAPDVQPVRRVLDQVLVATGFRRRQEDAVGVVR